MKNKGQILSIWGTFVLFLVIALVVLTMVAIYFLGSLTGRMHIEIAVERFINRPYIVGELFSHYTTDRPFFEHAVEIVVSGGVENSKSSGIEDDIVRFMERLGFDKKETYRIVIKDTGNSYVDAGEKAEKLNPKSSSDVVSNPEISNDAVVPLLYKKDGNHPDGILGYIHIVTEGG